VDQHRARPVACPRPLRRLGSARAIAWCHAANCPRSSRASGGICARRVIVPVIFLLARGGRAISSATPRQGRHHLRTWSAKVEKQVGEAAAPCSTCSFGGWRRGGTCAPSPRQIARRGGYLRRRCRDTGGPRPSFSNSGTTGRPGSGPIARQSGIERARLRRLYELDRAEWAVGVLPVPFYGSDRHERGPTSCHSRRAAAVVESRGRARDHPRISAPPPCPACPRCSSTC